MIADSSLELLKGIFPFKELPEKGLATCLRGKLGEASFQTGEELSPQGSLPQAVYLITEGSARALGSSDETPISLELIKPDSLVGWFPLATGVPCEWARAASPVKALRIPTESFLKLLKDHPDWASSLRSQTCLSELFPLIHELLKQRGLPLSAAKQIAIELLPQAVVSDSPSPITETPSPITYLPSSNSRRIGVPTDLLNTLLGTLGSGDSALTFDGTLLPQSSAALAGSPLPVPASDSDTQVSGFTFHPSSATPPPPLPQGF